MGRFTAPDDQRTDCETRCKAIRVDLVEITMEALNLLLGLSLCFHGLNMRFRELAQHRLHTNIVRSLLNVALLRSCTPQLPTKMQAAQHAACYLIRTRRMAVKLQSSPQERT